MKMLSGPFFRFKLGGKDYDVSKNIVANTTDNASVMYAAMNRVERLLRLTTLLLRKRVRNLLMEAPTVWSATPRTLRLSNGCCTTQSSRCLQAAMKRMRKTAPTTPVGSSKFNTGNAIKR